MWLVLCDRSDASALWAYQALRARGLAPLELVTADALALGDRLEHRLAGSRTTVSLRAVGGLRIDGDQLSGVLNRLYTVPVDPWRNAAQADRDYVQQELVALYLSWLYALPCPVLNRPTPQGLCGRWRSESEWVWLALQAELPVAPFRQSARDGVDELKGQRRLIAPGQMVLSVIVVGDAVTGGPAPPRIAAACRRLARLADAELLGIDFVVGAAGPWTFAGASPMPDLMSGGNEFIGALIRVLTAERMAA
ncbi:MAG: hypothetical protein ACM3PU_07865 [Gemmatimonadota bacterium]